MIDWLLHFRPATLAMLSGLSPFIVPGCFIPWVLLVLAPLALLPVPLGIAALFVTGLVTFAYSAKRMGASTLAMVIFLLSPPVVVCLGQGNVEWLVLLGFTLPPYLGMPLVLIKPQAGWAVALFWIVEAWKRGGWPEAIRTVGPTAVLLLASFMLFGFWPAQMEGLYQPGNVSLWPHLIPLGLVALALAIRMRKIEYAMLAGPCLSPYVLLHSWAGALLSLIKRPAVLTIAVAGWWAVVLIEYWR